jgi:serine/threonine protein phosphatase PrpC
MGFISVCRTDVGLKRKLNEDSVVDLTDRRVWAVADGMGGHDAGDLASAHIIESLSKLGEAPDVHGLLAQALESLRSSNAYLLEVGRTRFESKTVGSTVAGMVADGAKFACFWVGDSRIYRIRKGMINQLSRDHSLVQDLVEAGMLAAEDAESHPNANVVTRALGVRDRLEVDTREGDLEAGDKFLMASDGLTRVVRDIELLSAIHSRPLEEAADRLLELALERGAPDNVSFIIVEVT